jgi:hypothetical protein
VIVVALLLLAPLVAAALFWGSWPWFAASLVVAAVEYLSLRRSEQFSGRVWRSVGKGQRGHRARWVERVYVISAAIGVGLLLAAALGVG